MNKILNYVGQALYIALILFLILPMEFPLKGLLHYVGFVLVMLMTPYIIMTLLPQKQSDSYWQDLEQ